MLKIESIAKIRRMYHIQNKSIRSIAAECKFSRNTVRKVIRTNVTKFEMAKYVRVKPIIGKYLAVVNELLTINMKKAERYRLTSKNIHEYLIKIGYDGSYSTVNMAVRKFRHEYQTKNFK